MATLEVAPNAGSEPADVVARVRQELAESFRIGHATIEIVGQAGACTGFGGEAA